MKLIKNYFSVLIYACFLSSGVIATLAPNSPVNLTLLFWLLTILIIFMNLNKFKLDRFKIYILFLYLMLFIIILSSYFYSPSKIYGLSKIIDYILTITSVIGVIVIIKDKVKLEILFKSLIFISLFVSTISIPNFISDASSDFIRLGEINSIGMARFFGMICIILIINYLLDNTKKKILVVIWFFFSAFLLLLTSSKMPIIGTVISVFSGILLYLIYFKNIKLKVRALGMMITFLIAGLLLLVNFWESRVFNTLRIRFENFEGVDYARMIRYDTALDMFYSSPLIGNGVGSFSIYFEGVDLRSYPHNLFLEVLSELGLVGLLNILLLISLSVFSVYFSKKKSWNVANITVISLTIFFLLNAMVSGDINDNRLFFVFLTLSALNYKYVDMKNEK